MTRSHRAHPFIHNVDLRAVARWVTALVLAIAGCTNSGSGTVGENEFAQNQTPDSYVRSQCNGLTADYAACTHCVDVALDSLYAAHSITASQRKTLEAGYRVADCTPMSGGCVKNSCASLNDNCGTPSDGCGGSLASCGVCSNGDVCGAVAQYQCGHSCADGQTNGAETDVDCGGGTCAACGDGSACSANSDCTSNNCAGTCQAAVCSHAPCTTGDPLVPGCDPDDCVTTVCAGDAHCCEDTWDETCVDEVIAQCYLCA